MITPTNVILFGDSFSFPILAKVIEVLGERFRILRYISANSSSNVKSISFDFDTSSNNLNIEHKSDWLKISEIIPPNCLGISFSFSKILPKYMIQKFDLGIMNVHGGKLHEYAGPNALNWAIINNETKMTLTTHVMTETVDQGFILDEVDIPILFDDDALTLRTKRGEHTLASLPCVVQDVIQNPDIMRKGKIRKVERYLTKRTPDDGLFSWDMTNLEIYNLIRALVYPWPGARFHSNIENRIKVINKLMSLDEIEQLRRAESNSNVK